MIEDIILVMKLIHPSSSSLDLRSYFDEVINTVIIMQTNVLIVERCYVSPKPFQFNILMQNLETESKI